MFKVLALVGIAGCGPAAACLPTTPAPAPAVVVANYNEPTGDITPPTRLDILFPGVAEDTAYELCMDMGGDFVDDPANRFRCQGVDY